MAYRTARTKIAVALTEKLKEINGQHPYNSNVSDNVKAKMLFLDEIEQYPKVCVVSGNETREYLPGEFDAQEELALLLEDIERVIDSNDTLVYDDTVSPSLSCTELVVDSITTDEGVIAPLGIGEIAISVRY